MNIQLNEVLNIKPEEYANWTICLNNANAEQLYSFEENEVRLLEHISWKRHRGATTSFRNINTKYCLQFIRLDKDDKYDQWLFLGAYEVLGVNNFDDGHQTYNLRKLNRFSNFIERLIVLYKKIQGPKQAKIDISLIEKMEVVSILEKKYAHISRKFEGFDKISLPFKELKQIIKSNVDNWRELLKNINCIYAITDTLTGKIYIGSTYNCNGVWGRWSSYVATNGHGGDVELIKLLQDNPAQSDFFVFTILESFFNCNGTEQFILDRETYWKKVFCTRVFGHNKN